MGHFQPPFNALVTDSRFLRNRIANVDGTIFNSSSICSKRRHLAFWEFVLRYIRECVVELLELVVRSGIRALLRRSPSYIGCSNQSTRYRDGLVCRTRWSCGAYKEPSEPAAPLAIVVAPSISPSAANNLVSFLAQFAPDVAVGILDREGFRHLVGPGLEGLMPLLPVRRGVKNCLHQSPHFCSQI